MLQPINDKVSLLRCSVLEHEVLIFIFFFCGHFLDRNCKEMFLQPHS